MLRKESSGTSPSAGDLVTAFGWLWGLVGEPTGGPKGHRRWFRFRPLQSNVSQRFIRRWGLLQLEAHSAGGPKCWFGWGQHSLAGPSVIGPIHDLHIDVGQDITGGRGRSRIRKGAWQGAAKGWVQLIIVKRFSRRECARQIGTQIVARGGSLGDHLMTHGATGSKGRWGGPDTPNTGGARTRRSWAHHILVAQNIS